MTNAARLSTNGEHFDAVWTSSVLPHLGAVEQQRIAVRNRILLGWMLLLMVGLPVIVLLHQADLGSDPVAAAVTAVVIGTGVVWGMYSHRFRDRFKRDLVGRLIAAFDPRLSYSPDDAISQQEFERAGLVREYPVSDYGGEDLISGRIGATDIRFSEISATYTSDRSRRSKRRTLFSGVLFCADFNKHFSGSTYVLPDRAQKLFGGLGQSMQGMRSTYGTLVKLEDPEFERYFVVYATNQIEARYILSSALMERLSDFRRKHGHPMRIGFVDTHVYLGIQLKRNLFEPRLFRTLANPALYREFWDDLTLFVSIVEELNLNTRIWTKR